MSDKIDPIELEYQAAKAGYIAALARLKAAKAARPSKPVKRPFGMDERREAIWQLYVKRGSRDIAGVAEQFGLSRGHVRAIIAEERRRRSYGPPAPLQHSKRAPTHEEDMAECRRILNEWRDGAE